MIPPWLEAVILGLVQGLTEFIPISSSGHLVLVPYLMGWDKHSLAFDVMLHVGTLGAVLVYFRAELLAIARGLTGLDRTEQGRTYRRVGLYIVPASVPIAVVGLTLASRIESVFASPVTVSLLLLVTATLLLATERVRDLRVRRVQPSRAAALSPAGRGATLDGSPLPETPAWDGDWRATDQPDVRPTTSGGLPLGLDPVDPLGRGLGDLTLRQAMTVGLVQCLAVLPGVSRSGSTIAGGVSSGLTREAATRFSFLLAIPALLGATVLSIPDLAEGGETALELGAGMAAAFVSGYAAVRFLVALVSRERLTGFAWYCIAASVIGLVGYAMLGPISTV